MKPDKINYAQEVYQNNMGLKPRQNRRNIFGAGLKSPLQKSLLYGRTAVRPYF